MPEYRYQDFLNRVVDESVIGATQFYSKGNAMLEGAIAGLNACRDLSPPQLSALLLRARTVQHKALHKTVLERYWRVNCFMHEVEWVCDVISCALVNVGVQPIVEPTMKAAMLASQISRELVDNTN